MGLRTALDHDLVTIRDDILRLGSLVGQAVDRSIEAFTAYDTQLAQEVIKGDDAIDSLHHQLEERITTTVALQQPMAGDLRRLIADLLITNELERMGDYAEGIGRTTLRHEMGIPQEVPDLLKDMQQLVSRMIVAAMEAYLKLSPDLALEVARRDDEADALYRKLLNLIVARMGSGELSVDHGSHLMWVGHNLERIGDRVTNICERITYARTGDISDANPKPDESAPAPDLSP
jgi:phosphate transport system protein